MKKLIYLFVTGMFVLVLPLTISHAQQAYPIKLELINETVTLKNELVDLGKDILKAMEMQPLENGFDGISNAIISTNYCIFGLITLLKVENFHGAAKQYNNAAIQEIREYVYSINSQLDSFLEHCISIINITKNPTVIHYADKTKQLLNKTRELLNTIIKELPSL